MESDKLYREAMSFNAKEQKGRLGVLACRANNMIDSEQNNRSTYIMCVCVCVYVCKYLCVGKMAVAASRRA